MESKARWALGEEVPDQSYLHAIDDAESRHLERALATEREHGKRRRSRREALIRSAGMQPDELLEEEEQLSEHALQEAEANVGDPAEGHEQLHRQLDDLSQRFPDTAAPLPGEHFHSGQLSAIGGGWWWRRNGEKEEETPEGSYDPADSRVDLRTKARGEGNHDTDSSTAHGYLTFRFHPPTWGHLNLSTRPWFHGFYSLYSNDDWWNDEYAVALVDSWIDVHQHFWRSRDYVRRFQLWGHEVHPTRYGRIDRDYHHPYSADIAEEDAVTIRVGIRLHSKGRASGSHSVLDFYSGAGNYVYVPKIQWYVWRYD